MMQIGFYFDQTGGFNIAGETSTGTTVTSAAAIKVFNDAVNCKKEPCAPEFRN